MDLEFIRKLVKPSDTKIVLLLMDGLGGLPMEPGGLTELESAATPNLDALAEDGICGLHQPVLPGITPGSGPSHLAVFGYDPLAFQVGRGALAAAGINFPMQPGDLAARGNFCTVDADGKVTDRRAGRISSETNAELCNRLREIRLADAELFVETVKEYRFLLVLRGEGLSDQLADTDPQQTGRKPLTPKALSAEAERSAAVVEAFVEKAREALQGQEPANMVLLRGFAERPRWPSMESVFGVRPAAIAAYPMYRGLARLIGMDILETGEKVAEEFDTLEKHWKDYDFFYLHVKKIDSAGEDGDFQRKVNLIEEVDALIPRLRDLAPDVLIVTGDHSTPAAQAYHSWHPVPALLWSRYCRSDRVRSFGERACMTGGLGPRFPATDLIPLALANAGRLEKFGA
jgi:2,3-bisphosphoglycerate-independent phosphoglycerate mutase